jgi:hypothetical protein
MRFQLSPGFPTLDPVFAVDGGAIGPIVSNWFLCGLSGFRIPSPMHPSCRSWLTRFIPLAWSLSALALLSSIAQAAGPKVLFIGNSLTYGQGGTAGVPLVFQRLAFAAGYTDTVVDLRTMWGSDFQYHAGNATTLSGIRSQAWDFVVLQNYSTEPTHLVDGSHSIAKHLSFGLQLYQQIKANRAQTQVILYQTWSRAAAHSLITGVSSTTSFASTAEFQDELWANYWLLANSVAYDYPADLPVRVSPVGDAWELAGGLLPSSNPAFVSLFDPDNLHGNDNGYYLAAAVHYATIFGASPEGLSASSYITNLGLKTTVSKAFLERAAWTAVSTATRPVFVPPKAIYLFDFGADGTPTSRGASPGDPANTWNNVTASIGTSSSGVLPTIASIDGVPTTMALRMISRFGGANESGTLGSTVFAANATRDSLYGNTESYGGLSNVVPSFKLTGLSPTKTHTFAFYASRMDVTDNRSTTYTVTGANSGAATLNVANNVSGTTVVSGIVPTSAGEVTVTVTPGAANNNSNHFTYLGAMRMEVVSSGSGSGPAAPVVSSAGAAQGTVGSAFSYTITASNSPTSFGAAGLPAGLTLNTSTGAISGTPTSAGTTIATISATNSGGTGQATLTITIAAASSGSTTQTLLIDFGADATPTSLAASPNDPASAWNNVTATIGASSSGQLSNLVTTQGTATAIGLRMLARFNGANTDGTQSSGAFVVNATRDSLYGNTESWDGLTSVFPSFKLIGLDPAKSYTLTFFASRAGVSDNRTTVYTVTGASTSAATLTVANNVSGTTVVSGVTPTSAGEITISLTPAAANNNAYHFTYLGVLKVESASSGSGSSGAVVSAPVVTSAGTAQGTVGAAFSYAITASNSPTSFAATSLPAGLSLNMSTGAISGTPTSAGTTVATISATNSGGTGQATLTITIAAASSGSTTQTLLIDFGADATPTSLGGSPNDPASAWNNLTETIGASSAGQLSGLVTTAGSATAVGVRILTRFNGANTDGTQSSGVFAANATRDSLYGNTESWNGLAGVFPSFKLTGLSTAKTYTLTFFASRTGVSDNRSTTYTVTGASSGAATLNVANNVSATTVVSGITPTSAGEITITLAPAAANNNAYHFTYLGALKVE